MITGKSIQELSNLLGKKEISSVEIAEAYIGRIKEKNSGINAFITLNSKGLLAGAAEADKRRSSGKARSPYDGIPIAVKDNINTKGIRTSCGSRILENFVSPFDAHVSKRLDEQGFLVLGKTNMDEFAMGSTSETSFFGPVRNPYDPDRVPGGSSGGSAAAVAGMMAPGALGSDTGGSIRQPASFCGVVGIKPTYGRVSRFGLVAFASSLDQIGAFGGNVNDAALLLAAISGHDNRDTTSIDRAVDFAPDELTNDVRGMKIGIPDEYYTGVSVEITDAIMKRVRDLEKAGAEIVPVSLKYTEYAIPVYYVIATAEASSNLARYDGIRYGYRPDGVNDLAGLYTRARSEGFGREVKRRIILGTFSLSSGYYDAYYLQALKGRSLIIRDFSEAFSTVDALVTPVTTTTAFRIGELVNEPLQMYMSDILTISVNLAGIPAVSVPAGLDSGGLPIGMQIMGNHFQEKTIFSLARFIEAGSEKHSPEM